MTTQPLLTTVVGSYPQPDWLIDRGVLASSGVPRIRNLNLWRVPEEFLGSAQDDATILAIRDMERCGVDIISDGEMRRESYSNRFATALDGIDLDRPGEIIGRAGNPTQVPRVVGPIRRARPVQVGDLKFLRENTDKPIKATVPGPFTLAQQADNEHYPDRRSLAMDYAVCVNQEVKEFFAAGADVVQLDEPWLRNNPQEAKEFAVAVIDKALEDVTGTTALHLCFGYAAMGTAKPNQYDFLAELEASKVQQISIETAQPRLDLSVLREMPSKTIILGVLDLSNQGVESPEVIGARIREALKYITPDRLQIAPDCGLKYLPRSVALGKLLAMVRAVATVRESLG